MYKAFSYPNFAFEIIAKFHNAFLLAHLSSLHWLNRTCTLLEIDWCIESIRNNPGSNELVTTSSQWHSPPKEQFIAMVMKKHTTAAPPCKSRQWHHTVSRKRMYCAETATSNGGSQAGWLGTRLKTWYPNSDVCRYMQTRFDVNRKC